MAKKMDIFFRSRPPFVAQISRNSCWAASLETWFLGEQGFGWNQEQLINMAGDFTLGPGGINLGGLQQVINDSNNTSTIEIFTQVVERTQDIPQLKLILREVGYVYLAFSRPDGQGGHVNILSGFSGSSFDAVDPDPDVVAVTRPHHFYFTNFPALVGWRRTPADISIGWTGRAPWDYL